MKKIILSVVGIVGLWCVLAVDDWTIQNVEEAVDMASHFSEILLIKKDINAALSMMNSNVNSGDARGYSKEILKNFIIDKQFKIIAPCAYVPTQGGISVYFMGSGEASSDYYHVELGGSYSQGYRVSAIHEDPKFPDLGFQIYALPLSYFQKTLNSLKRFHPAILKSHKVLHNQI